MRRCACSRCAAVISGFRAMKASGSSSTTSKRLGSRLAAICAPVASEMSRSAEAPPVSTPTRILFNLWPPARRRAQGWTSRSSRQSRSSLVLFSSPTPNQLDLRNELHVEFLRDFALDERHEGSDVVRGRAVRIHDEVRVFGADHRATDGLALEARGFDEPAGVVAGRVAEDRAGIRLRERLLFDPLVRHLLDPLHRVRAVAGPPAEARADADDRRALQGACAVGVAKLVHPRGPGVAIHVDQLRVHEDVCGLATECAGVAVHSTADRPRDRRHPLESLDSRQPFWSTTPRMPRSATSRLVPPPRTKTESSF